MRTPGTAPRAPIPASQGGGCLPRSGPRVQTRLRARQRGLSAMPRNRAGPSGQGVPGQAGPVAFPIFCRDGASELPRRCWQGRQCAGRPGRGRGRARLGGARCEPGRGWGWRRPACRAGFRLGGVRGRCGAGTRGWAGSSLRLPRRRGGSPSAPRERGGRPGRLHLKDCISCLLCGVAG